MTTKKYECCKKSIEGKHTRCSIPPSDFQKATEINKTEMIYLYKRASVLKQQQNLVWSISHAKIIDNSNWVTQAKVDFNKPSG